MITSTYRFAQNFVRRFGPAIPMKEVSARLALEALKVKEAERNMEMYLQNEDGGQNLFDLFEMFASPIGSPKEIEVERFSIDSKDASLLEQDRMKLWRRHSRKPRAIGELAQKALNEVLKKDSSPGIAVELGCGNSGLVIELLKRDWTVIALDSSPHALNGLVKKIHSVGLSEIAEKRLTYAFQGMEDYNLPKGVSLVFGENSFPYSKAAKFERLWDKVHESLKTDGCIGGNLWVAPLHQETETAQRENGSVWYADMQMTKALLKDKGYDVTLLEQKGGWMKGDGGQLEFIGRKR